MGRLALAHRGRAHVLPPIELLEPYIERTNNHWYWLGEFHDNNEDRSAEFRWAAPFESSTLWMVPRLLWQHTHADYGRLLLENVCGLFTCINPAHWRKRQGTFRIPARIVLPDTVEATPVMHPLAVLTVHIRRLDSLSTVCGRGRDQHALAKTTVITCDECISAWVRTSQPFTEVK